MSRIIPALWTFLAIVGLADLFGPGHHSVDLVLLVCWFYLIRALPERGIRALLTAAFGFSIAVAALAVVQMWFMPRARGPFLSPNFLGAYAVLMLFLASGHAAHQSSGQRAGLNEPGAPSLRYMALANLLSLALSQSRGAILALGAGLTVMLARKRPMLALAATGTAIGVVLLIRTGAAEARLGIWLVAWQAASQRLVLGYGQDGLWISGLGTFYSIPLQWLVNTGIPGVLAGGWLLFEAVRSARDRPALQAFIAAWFVQGLFLFSIPATAIPLFAVLGYLAKARTIPAATQSAAVMTQMTPKPSGS